VLLAVTARLVMGPAPPIFADIRVYLGIRVRSWHIAPKRLPDAKTHPVKTHSVRKIVKN